MYDTERMYTKGDERLPPLRYSASGMHLSFACSSLGMTLDQKLQDKLFEGMNVEEIYKKAKEYSVEKQKTKKA